MLTIRHTKNFFTDYAEKQEILLDKKLTFYVTLISQSYYDNKLLRNSIKPNEI